MIGYAFRRLLLAVPTVIGVSILAFLMIHLIPGNVVQVMLGTGSNLSAAQVHDLERLYGLNRPLAVQYLDWAGRLLRGDLGTSLRSGVAAAQLIGNALTVTLELTVLALTLAVLVAVAAGIYSAVRRGGWGDLLARLASMIGLSLPNFWLGTMLILLVSFYAPSLSSFSWTPFWQGPGANLTTMLLPTLALSIGLMAILMRQTRAAMLEVLRKQYITTARAKGVGERVVILRHAFRNALIPVITIIGLQLGYLMGGAVVIENVFSLPGMGRLVVDAINQRDYPLVQGTIFLIAVVFTVVNLLVDLTYAAINPQIRYD